LLSSEPHLVVHDGTKAGFKHAPLNTDVLFLCARAQLVWDQSFQCIHSAFSIVDCRNLYSKW